MTREFAIALAAMNLACDSPGCGPTLHAGFLQARWEDIEAEAEVMLMMAEQGGEGGPTRSD